MSKFLSSIHFFEEEIRLMALKEFDAKEGKVTHWNSVHMYVPWNALRTRRRLLTLKPVYFLLRSRQA